MSGELEDGRMLKSASKMYGRLKLPGYGHSVPVQELLKEPHWNAYQEGRWGSRPNPPAPIGDVRPGAAAGVPVGERSMAHVVPISSDDESSSSSSSHSQQDSDSPDSSPEPRLRVRHLTRRIPTSDPEEASEETGERAASASPPRFPALRIAPTVSMTQAVTTSVFYASQVEANGASPTIIRTSRARESLSQGQRGIDPPNTDSREAVARSSEGQHNLSRVATPVDSPRIGWTPTGSEPGWAPVETDSWEEFEEAAQQNVQGTTEKAMDYAIDVLGLLRTELETQLDHQTETL